MADAKSTNEKKPTCFMAMPITTHDRERELHDDEHHWRHVMETLFEEAIREAGFEPIRPVSSGSYLIHGQIIRHLSEADLVLCDLSSHNPNVFFELGVRTSLNRPVALVRDEHTTIPFDTSGMNVYPYKSTLRSWNMKAELAGLTQHIVDAVTSCGGKNPMWNMYGLTIKAEEPTTTETPLEAKLDLLTSQLDRVRRDQQTMMVDTAEANRRQTRTRVRRTLAGTPIEEHWGTNSGDGDQPPLEALEEALSVDPRQQLLTRTLTNLGETLHVPVRVAFAEDDPHLAYIIPLKQNELPEAMLAEARRVGERIGYEIKESPF